MVKLRKEQLSTTGSADGYVIETESNIFVWAGGDINIISGQGASGFQSGDLIIYAADSIGSNGGAIGINGGGTDLEGGSVEIIGGNSSGSLNAGGHIYLAGGGGAAGGGAGLQSGDGLVGPAGTINITVGSTASGYDGSAINITAGSASNSADGGKVTIRSGADANARSGDIELLPGLSELTVDGGSIVMTPVAGSNTNGSVYISGDVPSLKMSATATGPVSPASTQGLIWVKNSTGSGTMLMFTDDALNTWKVNLTQA